MSNAEKTVPEGTVLLRVNLFALAAVVACLAVSCFFLAQKTIVLEVDGEQKTVKTFATTVGELLARQEVVLLEKDQVEPDLRAKVQRNMRINVSRATELTIRADGVEIPARTMARQVAEVLAEYQISLGPQDEVEPALESPVVQGLAVKIARVSTESLTCEVPIDYGIKRDYTLDLPAGRSRVAQEGKAGKERQFWQVTFRDGVEVFRQLVSREVLVAPVDQLLVCGSAATVSRGGENLRYSRSVTMRASAYTHSGNKTASGTVPHYGVVSVDPSTIPFGAKLYVDGYGYATALDRGRAIKGNRIDLFFDTRQEAMNWGVRWVEVYFLD